MWSRTELSVRNSTCSPAHAVGEQLWEQVNFLVNGSEIFEAPITFLKSQIFPPHFHRNVEVWETENISFNRVEKHIVILICLSNSQSFTTNDFMCVHIWETFHWRSLFDVFRWPVRSAKINKVCQPLKAVQSNMADRSISNLRIKLPLNCARTKPAHRVVDCMSVLHISAWKSETCGDEALLIGWDYITVLHLSSSGAQSFLWLIFPYGDSGAVCSAGQI